MEDLYLFLMLNGNSASTNSGPPSFRDKESGLVESRGRGQGRVGVEAGGRVLLHRTRRILVEFMRLLLKWLTRPWDLREKAEGMSLWSGVTRSSRANSLRWGSLIWSHVHKGRVVISPKHGPLAISCEFSMNKATWSASFLATYFDWLSGLSSSMRRALANEGSFNSEAN